MIGKNKQLQAIDPRLNRRLVYALLDNAMRNSLEVCHIMDSLHD